MLKRKTQIESLIELQLESLLQAFKANDEQGINSALTGIMKAIEEDKNSIAVTIDWVLKKSELSLLETLLKKDDFRNNISKEVLREDILNDVIISCSSRYGTKANDPLEIVKTLVEKGANINPSTSAVLLTPVSLVSEAASLKDLKLAEFLIKNGSPVDKSAGGGFTALHRAAENNSYEIVKMLLENGASTSVWNRYGKLPLQLAQNPEIVKILLAYGSPIEGFRSVSPEVKKMIELAKTADKIILGTSLEKPSEILPEDAAFLVKRMVYTTLKDAKPKLTLEQISDFFNKTVLEGHSPVSFSFSEKPNTCQSIFVQVDESLEAVQKGYLTLGDIMTFDTDS